jgi:hypothetical protein
MAFLVALLAGCAQSTVQTRGEVAQSGLPRPQRILVHNFAVSADDVKQSSGLFATLGRELANSNQTAEQIEIGREVSDALAEELTARIRALGFDTVRANPATPLVQNSLVIAGRFVNIDEGNRLRRTVIGLGAGQSSVDVTVSLFAPGRSGYRELATFDAHADSGNMPGAAVTGPAGAAAGASTAAVVATSAAMGVAKGYRSMSTQQARQIADKIVEELSRYFARQGWIAP